MRNVKNGLVLARELLAGHPLLGAQPEALRESLLADASLCALEEGAAVFNQGQPALFWYVVLEGRIDTLRYGMDGEERVIQHVGRGQLLAPVVMFMPQRQYPVGTRAAMPSLLCRLHRENLRRACLEHPPLALDMLDIAGQALSSRIDDVDSLAGFNAPQRLATYLLRLPRRAGQNIELPLSQRQLAAKLGVRAETLNRLLAEWQRQGVLEGKRRQWRIAEIEALEAQARS
ncbi:Crp/Fnr family transcriptional regulator [Pseudomonas sp. 273]|uniref:Crp/Fnr family transcriptional regulator n=1 Tax=Pseudomonas sp. 273 TaxID=75692 RepID=UPI0023D80736|nr:Crp/Fnr family transcriptional regulator [Pseudomonas sp. 273]